ncbi:MAG: hypothetical protein AB4426_09905 [Xenococcaceae cyanobacterium]
MAAMLKTVSKKGIFYPSSDGEPLAETYTHLYAMLCGYRLGEENYELIRDSRSEPLRLRLAVEGELKL